MIKPLKYFIRHKLWLPLPLPIFILWLSMLAMMFGLMVYFFYIEDYFQAFRKFSLLTVLGLPVGVQMYMRYLAHKASYEPVWGRPNSKTTTLN